MLQWTSRKKIVSSCSLLVVDIKYMAEFAVNLIRKIAEVLFDEINVVLPIKILKK